MLDGGIRPVLIVTGGSRGLGAAMVQAGLARGAHVAYCSRTPTPLAPTDGAVSGTAPNSLWIQADVAREADVERLFDDTLTAFGRVDAVVNNAAINRPGLLVSLPDETWDTVVANNLTSAFLVARRAVREFRRQATPGRLVFMGSLMQEGTSAGACYATTKAAQRGLALAIARAYGRYGITANVVVCGYVETDLTGDLTEEMRRALVEKCPQRRAGRAEEVAAAVAFLTLGDGVSLTGQILRVSGGLTEVPA